MICQKELSFKFEKLSPRNQKVYKIYSCPGCEIWHIHPRPTTEDLKKVHDEGYFAQRTSRGYDNYQGEKVRQSVVSTLEKNLKELGFYRFEQNLTWPRRALEIGSAAGYFVEYLKERGWEIMGIDISSEMCQVAQERGLPVFCGDFIEITFRPASYDLIAMWATLEHWSDPRPCFDKVHYLLKTGGKFFISTTNTGFWARIYGKNWRYLNVPEHVFYFNRRSLSLLAKQFGFQITNSFTYGSGFTTTARMSPLKKVLKFIADRLAKIGHSGDMIVVEFTKTPERD